MSVRVLDLDMFISRLERGLSARLDETTAIRIADALGVSPAALFGESDR